ncbi:DUF4034 domain-containing protein [bacterium]|nr:DUF4034 domain-containing protein [bacterium]
MKYLKFVALSFAILTFYQTDVKAEIYQWKDSTGKINYTNDISKIPAGQSYDKALKRDNSGKTLILSGNSDSSGDSVGGKSGIDSILGITKMGDSINGGYNMLHIDEKSGAKINYDNSNMISNGEFFKKDGVTDSNESDKTDGVEIVAVNSGDKAINIDTNAPVTATKIDPYSYKLNIKGDIPSIKKSSVRIIARELLRAKKFKELNRFLSKLERDFEQDFTKEGFLFAAYFAFETGDTNDEALIDDWIKEFPKNNIAHIAKAIYYKDMGWRIRGNQYIKLTADSKIKQMNDYFIKSMRELRDSEQNGLDHVVLYDQFMSMLFTMSLREEANALYKKALTKYPQSSEIRATYLHFLSPKWGGSFTEMTQYTDSLAKDKSIKNDLKDLSGVVYNEMASLILNKDTNKALQLINKALEYGKSTSFYRNKIAIYNKLNDYGNALKTCEECLEESIYDSQCYKMLGDILLYLKRNKEAYKYYEISDYLRPNQDNIKISMAKLRAYIAKDDIYEKFGKKTDTKLTDNVLNEYKLVIQNFTKEIEASPFDPYLYYIRGTLHRNIHNFDLAVEDFIRAISLKPTEYEFYYLLDYTLSFKRDFKTIIEYWTKYLELNPKDGDAYLERSGAYKHYGNMKSAKADLEMAAYLGNKKAEQFLKRYPSDEAIKAQYAISFVAEYKDYFIAFVGFLIVLLIVIRVRRAKVKR